MEPEVRKLFWSLHENVLIIFYQWKIYRQLFDSGKHNIELLNRSGSNVFALLQKLITDDLFLGLCRLTDPVKVNGHRNLSLRYFLNQLGASIAPERRRKLKAELADLDKLTQNIRLHRRQRLAHLDVRYASKAEPLPPVLRGEIDDALEIVEGVMKDFHLIVTDGSTAYKEPSIAYGCDGEYLLHVLSELPTRKKVK